MWSTFIGCFLVRHLPQKLTAAGIGMLACLLILFYIRSIAAGATKGPCLEAAFGVSSGQDASTSIGADLRVDVRSNDQPISTTETLTIRAGTYSSFLPKYRAEIYFRQQLQIHSRIAVILCHSGRVWSVAGRHSSRPVFPKSLQAAKRVWSIYAA